MTCLATSIFSNLSPVWQRKSVLTFIIKARFRYVDSSTGFSVSHHSQTLLQVKACLEHGFVTSLCHTEKQEGRWSSFFHPSSLRISRWWCHCEPFPHLFFPPPAMLHQVVRGCSGPCSCPPTPPSCPVGVSSVLDECGCCKVCAQQFNQDCGPDKPCDHIKGLRCHLGAGGDPQRGLCRGEKTQHANMFPFSYSLHSFSAKHQSPLELFIYIFVLLLALGFFFQTKNISFSEKEVPWEFFRYLRILLFLNVLLRNLSHSEILCCKVLHGTYNGFSRETNWRTLDGVMWDALSNICSLVLLAQARQVPVGADVTQEHLVHS